MTGMANCSRRTGRWTLEDRFASPWHYLPVEVPPGTWGIRVELEHDRRAATLDLGIGLAPVDEPDLEFKSVLREELVLAAPL